MKGTMNDKRARIISIPLMSIFFMFVYGYNELVSVATVIQAFAVSFAFTFSLWEGNRAIVIYMRKAYPHNEQTPKRLFIQTLISIIFTFVATIAISYAFSLLPNFACTHDEMLLMAFLNLAPTFFVISIYEGTYFFLEWKKNIQRSEALAKENIRSQFEALKNQLDPHFLFNSLNTLAALIDDNNAPAQKYLEQLSDVYRYVLLSKQQETVTLREELTFVEAYIYLNKTRYRDNLIVENHIPENALSQKVAPLSIQILVENALKHNVISKDKPLTLRLSVDIYGFITVENNVQKKNILEKSTKTGLQNIINRYALLTSEKIEIIQNADIFSVRIPPIAHEALNY